MRGLIHEAAEGAGTRFINPILARLKRAGKRHRDDDAEKVRALAREVLNDWAAVTAFVTGSSWVSGCWIWCQATSAPTKAPRRAFPLLRVLWTN